MSDDVLIDGGPLVALLDRADDWHLRCRRVFESLSDPPLTVWPAVAEAGYLLRPIYRGEITLLQLVEAGRIRLALLDRNDVPRMRELMAKYHDLPMDLADAAIVRVAERERIHRVFTVDQKDFNIYRPAHLRRFTLLPPMISPA
jgi:predicted nucleic acid-binding protein